MGGHFESLKTTVECDILAQVIPKIRDAWNERTLVLFCAATDRRELVGVTPTLVTQCARRHVRLGKPWVKKVLSIGSDLEEHAQCSDIASVPKVALNTALAHASHLSYHAVQQVQMPVHSRTPHWRAIFRNG